eukprot:scaffold46194_cov206-Amphora_coffeaeformis.AAC.1
MKTLLGRLRGFYLVEEEVWYGIGHQRCSIDKLEVRHSPHDFRSGARSHQRLEFRGQKELRYNTTTATGTGMEYHRCVHHHKSRSNNKVQTKKLPKMKSVSSSLMAHVWIRVSFVVFFGLEQNGVDSFMLTSPLQPSAVGTGRSSFVMASSSLNDDVEDNDKDNDEEFDIMPSSSPEKSRMTDFIADFLKKSGQENSEAFWKEEEGQESIIDNPGTCTHLIAMPLDSCHELMLELESVQRGILYHCPILVHACIQQAITRLPLLYVRTSGPSATSKLFSIVEDVIEDHLLQLVEDSEDVDDRAMLNEDGTRPFTLQFTSLEIDGPKNEILQAVASVEDSNKLRTIVEDLQNRIHKETSWQTMLPPDSQRDHFHA